MKHRIYIYIIAALALIGCNQELLEKESTPDNCITITVFNSSLTTKATDQGSENERQLKRLDLFFYPIGNDQDKEECALYIQKSNLGNTGSVQLPLYVQQEVVDALYPGNASECMVYVIANLPETITFDGKETLKDLKDIVIASEEFTKLITNQDTYQAPELFIMSGHAKVKQTDMSISGIVPLERAASKITMKLNIPEYLDVSLVDEDGNAILDDEGNKVTERWYPYYKNGDPLQGIQMMHMGLHKGLKVTKLFNENTLVADQIFESGYTEAFSHLRTINVAGTTKNYYNYGCDITFYSYAFSWENDANDYNAPYFTLMIPWKRAEDAEYQTYYYQVVVNSNERKLVKNTWYDITLSVGVLGSRVQSTPTPLEDLTFRVIDWSSQGTNEGWLNENVDLKEWQYLIVPEKRVELNNTSTGALHFEASHSIGWVLEWPGSTEGLDDLEKYNTSKYAAYYINNRGTKPVGTQLTSITNTSFSVSSSGNELVFNHEMPEDMYSPTYAHVKIWLDIDGNGRINGDEGNFVEYVTFVQYPPIYITPSQSVAHSIFVNGINSTENGSADSDDIKFNNNKYNLGRIPGTSSSGDHMYVITVSRFEGDDTFERYGNYYQYLIGDPRVTESDTDLNEDNYDTSNNWATAKDVNGVERKLEYYYPTASQGDAFRVIAPKFRVVSFLSSGYSKITPEGAAMRCASFQENGYPAGRWRLPTYAEIQFIISLQRKQVIQDIFYSSNYYYSSTDLVQNSSSGTNYKAITSGATGSVRCVYDEWYWGDNSQDALPSTKYDGGFAFTWGDKER